MHTTPTDTTRRHPLAAGIYLILLAILAGAIIFSTASHALGATPRPIIVDHRGVVTVAAEPVPAKGGRIHPPCPASRTLAKRVTCLVKAVRWQQANVRHANLELTRVRAATPLMDTRYLCRIGEVVTGVPTSHCAKVVGCESGGNPRLDEYPYRNGAKGAGQYQPDTWSGTAFARAGFSLFDPLPVILAMDLYAARHGFNTGGGWAASYDCHRLSGPES